VTNQIQAYKDVITYLFNHRRFYTSDEINLAVEHPMSFLKECKEEDGHPYIPHGSNQLQDLADAIEKKWMGRWVLQADDAELIGDIDMLLKESLYITAIKIFRNATGASLIDSKNFVEQKIRENELKNRKRRL